MATLIDRMTAEGYRRDGASRPSPWQAQAGETVAERTRRGIRFTRDDDPKRGRITTCAAPVHYKDQYWDDVEAWKPIDLDVVETPAEGWDCGCETNGYHLRIWDSREVAGKTVRFVAEWRQADARMRVCPLALYWVNAAGDRELIARTQAAVRTIDNDARRVEWTDAFGSGRHFRYNLKPDECFKTVVIDDSTDLPTPTISDPDTTHLVVVMAVSWGGCNSEEFADSVVVDDVTGEDDPVGAADEEWVPTNVPHRWHDGVHDLVWMQPPKAWDSATTETDTGTVPTPNTVNATWRFRRYGNRALLLIGVAATMLQQATFPVYLDATMTQESVGAQYDDAFNKGATHPGDGNFNATDGYSEQGYEGGGFWIDGVRFTSVPLAGTDNVLEAYCSYWCTGGENKDRRVSTACVDSDDTATWAATTNEPYDGYVARTTAEYHFQDVANWTTGQRNAATDFRGSLQEVLDRGGWSENNDISVIVWYRPTSAPGADEYQVLDNYDSGTSHPATLDVEYSETNEVVAKTFTWDSTLESWAGDTAATKITYARETADGDPTNGCLKATSSGKNNNETGYWYWTGDWEDLNVPSGATVVSVRLCQLATYCVTRTGVDRLAFDNAASVGAQWLDSTATDTLTLWSGRVPTTTDSYWHWVPPQTWQTVPAGDQASTTSIELRLHIDVDHGSSGTPESDLRWDSFTIEVEYTPGATKHDLSGTLASTGGGTAAGTGVAPLSGTLAATGGGTSAGTVVSSLSGTLAATGGGTAAGNPVASLSGTLAASAGGTAAGTVEDVIHVLSGTLASTGGGTAAGNPVASFSGTLAASAGGSAVGTVVAPLSGTLAATGGGTAAGTVETPVSKQDLSGTLASTGGGSAAGNPVASLSGTLASTGGGSAAGTVMASLSGTMANTGGGTAAGTVMASLSGTLASTGGGTAAGNPVASLAGTLSVTGGGTAAGAVVVPLSGTLAGTGGGTAAGTVEDIPHALSGTLGIIGGGTARDASTGANLGPKYGDILRETEFGFASTDRGSEING